MSTVIAKFYDHDSAREAVEQLIDAGMERAAIQLIVIDSVMPRVMRQSAQGKVSEAAHSSAYGGFVDWLSSIGVRDAEAAGLVEDLRNGIAMVAVSAPVDILELAENVLRARLSIAAGSNRAIDHLICFYDHEREQTAALIPAPPTALATPPPTVKELITEPDLSQIPGPFYHRESLSEDLPDDLERLADLKDYEIADGEPDPRGWELLGANQTLLGTITGLLASPSAQKAYFAIVENSELLPGRQFLLPLADIIFNREEARAYSPYAIEQFRDAPPYREYEPDYRQHFNYWHSL